MGREADNLSINENLFTEEDLDVLMEELDSDNDPSSDESNEQ